MDHQGTLGETSTASAETGSMLEHHTRLGSAGSGGGRDPRGRTSLGATAASLLIPLLDGLTAHADPSVWSKVHDLHEGVLSEVSPLRHSSVLLENLRDNAASPIHRQRLVQMLDECIERDHTLACVLDDLVTAAGKAGAISYVVDGDNTKFRRFAGAEGRERNPEQWLHGGTRRRRGNHRFLTVVLTIRASFHQPERVRNIIACLHALNQQDLHRGTYWIVAVEQDREPRLEAALRPLTDRYVFACDLGPFNRSRGLNIGARYAPAGSVLCLIDADLLVPSDFLSRSLEHMYPARPALAPYAEVLYLDEDSTRRAIGARFDGPEAVWAERYRGYLLREVFGGCVLVDQQLYWRVGGHDEAFRGWGKEDEEFWRRLSRLVVVERTNDRLMHLSHARALKDEWTESNISYFDRLADATGPSKPTTAQEKHARPARAPDDARGAPDGFEENRQCGLGGGLLAGKTGSPVREDTRPTRCSDAGMHPTVTDLSRRSLRVLWGDVFHSLRPKQWLKNVLVAAAPFAAGVLNQPAVINRTFLTSLAFTSAAAATYLANDVVDRTIDRVHPAKNRRAIASGRVSVRMAQWTAAGLAGAGCAVGWIITPPLMAVILAYLILGLLYDLWFRTMGVVDLGVVALGFVLRVMAGGVSTGVRVSAQLLTLTFFAAFFVVAGKRYSELMGQHPEKQMYADRTGAYTAPYLRYVWMLASTLALVAYCLWVWEAGRGYGVLARVSVLPFSLAVLRYALLIERGACEAPEEVVLTDRMFQVILFNWIIVFGCGVYVVP
jgi:decaprenyl-phosphate phosphoribosyltransferase